MLIGRERECARLDELLDGARVGRSGALVLRGEAGIGKTALLAYAAERAEGMNVVRALGVESEAELEFSALLDVCRPLLVHVADIADRQAEALRAALGLGPAVVLDRFAVGAATLSLLAAAAEANPLLVLVDDAQWLDRSSQEALSFATKRLQADAVLVLYAAREGEERFFDAPAIESLWLPGLAPDLATSLIRAQVDIHPEVADELYASTGGNPLALIELPSLLSPEQLRGDAPLERPLPAGSGVERAFARRAGALSEESRKALLVAAISTSSAADLILRALADLGLPASSLEAAEDAGLLTLTDGRLEFRHPLVRSAVFQAAAPSERRAAHRALAAACGDAAPEEWAWHLGAAAVGPDEEVASALERSAGETLRRSGFAAAADGLERAARLTPDRDRRSRRLAAAADAAWRAGRAEMAAKLVAETLEDATDRSLRAEGLRLLGALEYVSGRTDAAAASLLEAVRLLEDLDPARAVEVAADAVNALVRLRQPALALETAEKARSLAPADGGELDLEATLVLGFALWFDGRHLEAGPPLVRAIELLDASTTIPGPLRAGRIASALDWQGRYGTGRQYLSETVARARAAGAVGSLAGLLAVSSWQALHASRWDSAHADAGEALALADELGQPVSALQALGVLTWLHALRGDDERCRAYAEQTNERADAFGLKLYEHLVMVCLGQLDLGAGRIDEAVTHLEQAANRPLERGLYVPGFAAHFDLVEAYVRADRLGQAHAVLESFGKSELVRAAPMLAALVERCRGLVAEPEHFDGHFREALRRHERVESPFALARTQLCYGERLRRAGRRVEAREQLRSALEVFARLEATPWTERAGSELRASGEKLRRRDTAAAEQLTPQELQIALQVAEGKTNKEVGAAVFLSHKTVEFHLSRIYRKLDMNSRAELIRRFAAEGAPVLPSATESGSRPLRTSRAR